jgi:hypothetical protein
MLLYLYFITLCKKHVHCDIIFTKLQAQFNSLSLSLIDNTKTRISNIIVVYIDAVSIHSFIYIFSKFSCKKKVHLQMSIRIGNKLLILSTLRLSVSQNDCFYKVYQYPDVESYPIFCNYCCHMAMYFFMNTLPLICMA